MPPGLVEAGPHQTDTSLCRTILDSVPDPDRRMSAEDQSIAAPYLNAFGRGGRVAEWAATNCRPAAIRGGIVIRLHILAKEDVALVIEHISAIKNVMVENNSACIRAETYTYFAKYNSFHNSVYLRMIGARVAVIFRIGL